MNRKQRQEDKERAIPAPRRPSSGVQAGSAADPRHADSPEAHYNLGCTLKEQGRLDQAVVCFRRAIDLRPNFPKAYYNLGDSLRKQGRPQEAMTFLRRSIELGPDIPESYNSVGILFLEHRPVLIDAAISCFEMAIRLRPDWADAHSNLGVAFQLQNRLDEAVACFQRAVDLNPDFVAAHCNLGAGLGRQRHLDGAGASLRKAIVLKPDFAEAHSNLANVLLTCGEMAEGWKEYEWRWKTPGMIASRRNFVQPQWRGEAAEGRTLLIHAEQGFGDTLQFCRYAPLAAQRGLRVVLEVQKPLVRLLGSLSGVDLVVECGQELPAFDLHCPMLSMPLAMGTTLATIPGATPYLYADRAQVASWRTRLAGIARQGPRVGLVWAGDPGTNLPNKAAVDRRRSVAPDRLAPLFEVPGRHFISLQKSGPAAPGHFPLTDLMEEMTDFADTAALIANLDLVISVDTAVAHLAGALGKPVWMLDRFDPCWRWLAGRNDSPWYPKLRIYRQVQAGDWETVLAEVVRDLSKDPVFPE